MHRLLACLLVFCVAGLLAPGCASEQRPVKVRAKALAEDEVVSREQEDVKPKGRPVRVVAAQDEKPQPKKEDGKPFELPKDTVGKLLGEVLPPAKKQGPLEAGGSAKPPAMPMPRGVEPPTLLPTSKMLVARMPSPKRTDMLRPRTVLPELFDGGLQEPMLPRSPSFDAGKPVAVEAEDVSIPPPLPILAIRVPDRVATDDFTLEASTATVLKAEIPKRTTPAPFTKSGVPEPFENRKPLPTTTPAESNAPVSDGPAVPK